ncbi:MAG: amidohydrolase family protein [Gemmatimonadota bacterium]|nr:amidohydrolase family protein [Gemmatimonadota bacterium]
MDLVICGGTVVDGNGGVPVPGDVAVSDGRIAGVGRFPRPEGVPCVDASGCYVTPGFIDIHSHSDFTLMIDPRAVSSITQGVTLEVVGNCGHGSAPIGDPARTRSNIYGCRTGYEIDWRTVGEYLDRLEDRRPAVNVMTLVPNGNLRLAACDALDRPSTADELVEMKRLLAQGLEEGAAGYSTGLEYGTERECPEEEIAVLCSIAAEYGGIYTTHTRNRIGEAEEAIGEAIRTAAEAGAPLQISHISSVARLADDGGWAVDQALEQVDRARAGGLDVQFDMHTRLFGTTNLSAALPLWVLEGNSKAVAGRLRDPSVRREMESCESIVASLAQGDWERIVVFHSPAQPELAGKPVAELAAAGSGNVFDAICDVLIAASDRLHEVMVIAFSYREADVRPAFEHPFCMVGSDATALATDGPLKDDTFHGAYTWASWFFRHFVRDRKLFSPQEAVRRLTSLPASRLGLTDRGVIRKGAQADLAIFDPNVFAERGTTLEPNRTAAGMRHVLVNGGFAVRNGVLAGQRYGRVLRRA